MSGGMQGICTVDLVFILGTVAWSIKLDANHTQRAASSWVAGFKGANNATGVADLP